MYPSVLGIVSSKQRHQRSTWLLLCAVLINLLCVCQSQNELLLRTVAYPYPLSFNIREIDGSSMTDVSSTTDGNLYRTLTLHDGKLFVGGRSQLFSVTTEDLSQVIGTVTGSSDSTNHVDNYVTVIQPIGDNLLECGTSYSMNFGRPYCRLRSSQNISVSGSPMKQESDTYITALKPDQNTSWLLVNGTGGSDYHIYVGSELSVSEPNVAKVNLEVNNPAFTITDNLISLNSRTYLNEPQFVGDPIDYNGRIYFFFREYATEHINGGRIVFSRVARVCKNESGGKSFTDFDGKFVTFAKARLACSVAGTYNFYYNDIQDVYQSTNDTNVVYAIFTTERGIKGSALCAYRLDELDTLFFESRYRAPHEGGSGNLWVEVPLATEPFVRERSCPSSSTQDHSIPTLMTIKTFTVLLDEVAESKLYYETFGTTASNPLLVSTQERFSQIVVDNSINTSSADVFFIGTESGSVLKAYLNEDRSEALVVEEISLNTDGVKPVLSMVKSDSDQAVFVGTDSRVYKIPFVHCCDPNSSYAGDPYCKMPRNLPGCSVPGTITIHSAPSDRTRAINITDQPVHMYLTGNAPGGENLRVVGEINSVDCGDCEPLPYTAFTSVAANRTEYVLVIINATSSNETKNCTCSISLEIDSGAVDTRNFTLTVDSSAKITANETELREIADFDNNVVSYQFKRNKWLEKVGESCMLENVGICTAGDSNCP